MKYRIEELTENGRKFFDILVQHDNGTENSLLCDGIKNNYAESAGELVSALSELVDSGAFSKETSDGMIYDLGNWVTESNPREL